MKHLLTCSSDLGMLSAVCNTELGQKLPLISKNKEFNKNQTHVLKSPKQSLKKKKQKRITKNLRRNPGCG
jgi:hypothetical protein